MKDAAIKKKSPLMYSLFFSCISKWGIYKWSIWPLAIVVGHALYLVYAACGKEGIRGREKLVLLSW